MHNLHTPGQGLESSFIKLSTIICTSDPYDSIVQHVDTIACQKINCPSKAAACLGHYSICAKLTQYKAVS